MGAPRRSMVALATLGVFFGVAGCAPGGSEGSAVGTMITSTPSRSETSQQADPTDSQTRRPRPAVTQRPTARSHRPTADPSTSTPVTSRTIVPRPTYSPHTICPDISELNPVLSATRLGVHPEQGTDIVELTFTYTNAEEHALFLMGSVGYVDSEGYESDLYGEPGALVFDDFRLERGTHTVVLELEDIWGEAPESTIYFTYWSLAGVALDSSRPIPCEPNRGYSSH